MADPRVFTRKEWRAEPAKAPRILVDWHGVPVRLHHTAIPFGYKSLGRANRIAEEKAHMRLLQQVGFGRGYNDISYNFVVFPSGRVFAGRGFEVLGAHTLHHNEDAGICLAGNFEVQRVTRRAKWSVKRFRKFLRKKYGVTSRIIPHCRTFSTACPGDEARKAFGLSCGP